MVPAELAADSTTSSEVRVFRALAAADVRATALHSLNLPTHQYKLTSELDFVLVMDEIVLVIEVKGAQVSCHHGLWTYTDRSGHHRQDREGPFKQVTSGMYALRDRLRTHIGAAVDDVAFGFLVVTTDVDLPVSSFEWERETYCGRGDFQRDFVAAIARAAKYWRARQPKKAPINKALKSMLLKELRPSFDRSPLLDARASSLDLAYVRLTDEQFSRLDLIRQAPRVLCTGGAGTGKTFLAAEVARREAQVDRSVLFVCRSPVLAAFVRGMLVSTPVDVCTVDQLPRGKSFDVIVVDEAQDLMTFDHLDRLEPTVKGGWSDGRWVMFMDPNRQAHLYGDFDADALQFVEALNPVPAALRANCRNTREIAFQTRALTGADTGVAAAGAGPEVTFVPVPDVEAEAAALQSHLQLLRDQEVAPAHITIVSLRGDWATSAAARLREARKGKVLVLDEQTAPTWPGEGLSWASAVDMKGLENRFVCVIDIDSLDSERDIDLLYVALSRPRVGLWIATPDAITHRITDLYAANAPGALEALKKG